MSNDRKALSLWVLVLFYWYSSHAAADEDLKEIAVKFQDATSYFLLGQKFSLGQAYDKAVHWYTEAAKLGHLRSKLKLGAIYFEGLGTGSDYDSALYWLRDPANNGYNAAQYMLGMIYVQGTQKVRRDPEKAFGLLKSAADDFHTDALYQVGKMYAFGIGVEKDIQKAKKYLSLAGEQKVASASMLLAQLLKEEETEQAAGSKNPGKDSNSALGKFVALQASALKGDRQAQTALAKLFLEGSAAHPKDIHKAIDWFQVAAENGWAEAQYSLGNIYLEGKLVARDTVKAEKWLFEAANNGSKAALPLVAQLEAKRKKPTQKGFMQAAKDGDKEAQFNLGLMYLYGKNGLQKNRASALKWLKQAADQNHIKAQYHTGMIYYQPESEDNGAAYDWLTKAASNGHADAQYFLGSIYNQQGQYSEAIKWLDNAAVNNHSEALDLLVEMYLKGKIQNPNAERLLAWLEKSSLNGFRDAQFALGTQYLNREDVANNTKLAYAWIEKAARKGHTVAKYHLGMMLKSGLGVRKHYTKSARWLKEAAKDGNAAAQFELAQLYHNGVGLPRSKAKAKKWYGEAARQGHTQAKIVLGRDSRF
ncbi:MAG: sel1 repeat family protein [Gammaproteobacteria bacterium]|nr:sel1 repeat family protein [Gammaproteobacteria bacterium]MDH5799433.1 sel1 repeat family protein [Gammaproteobacteria bacterium]